MRKYIAEFIGTFALVFCGTGAIIVNEVTRGEISHVGIAITFGLIVMAMIYSIGEISGAHMNPAVSVGFAINGKFKWRETVPYIISQLAGAILASYILSLIFTDSLNHGMTLPMDDPMKSFVMEIIITFFLMFVILHVATGSKEQGMFAGLAIGATVLLSAMFAGPVTGASMNPARSFAPALISNNWEHLWVYVTAPFIGAAIAVIVYRFLKN